MVGGKSLFGYDAKTWWIFVAITIGPQLLGHSVVNRVLRTTSATVVSVAILFEIVGAAVIAWWWFGETPSAGAYPAAVLIAPAWCWWCCRAESPPRRSTEVRSEAELRQALGSTVGAHDFEHLDLAPEAFETGRAARSCSAAIASSSLDFESGDPPGWQQVHDT